MADATIFGIGVSFLLGSVGCDENAAKQKTKSYKRGRETFTGGRWENGSRE